MKLVGATIDNYKSFGQSENFLYIDNLNAIIGKNESGKSNLLECLEDIKDIGLSNDQLFRKNNKKSDEGVKLKLEFETRADEEFLYGNYQGKVTVSFDGLGVYTINKEFGDYIVNLKEYKEILEKIYELKNEVPIMRTENRKKMLSIIESFQKVDEKIFVETDLCEDFCRIFKDTDSEKISKLMDLFDRMIVLLDSVYLNFPSFIKIENTDLKNRYTISELKKELKEYNDNSILYQLFIICGIDSNKLIRVMESGESTKIRECEEKIQESVNKNFVKKFNDFYSQEKLVMAVDIKSDCLDFMIKSTSGAYLLYSERSNGFKWYISVFIQLLYKQKTSRKMNSHILLLDEPGVYLHANAQKELLNLLKELSRNKEQIIYTTHSPFMIDRDNLNAVRALIKDDNGNTHIHNKITTIPTSEKSKYDTFAPILYALGCDGSYDLGPSDSKLNIITEGVTDYYCLMGYFESVEKENCYKIIPSNGADNVVVTASILFGWGYDFVILLDQDDKGRSVYQSLKDTNSPFLNKVIFADFSKEIDTSNKYEIENVFSEEDRQKFGFVNADYKDKKYNYVTDMLTKIKCKEERYDDVTIKNFNSLFKEIEKLYK